MCALRTNRAVSAIALACQYRLDLTPRRPEKRRLVRPRKSQNQEQVPPEVEEETQEESLTKQEEAQLAQEARRTRTESLCNLDDFSEEFDFDADDDVMDPPGDDMELTQRYYIQACQEQKVQPIRRIFLGLVDEEMVCKNTVMKPADAKAATIALLGNSICETVHFEANVLGPMGGVYFADVLSKNLYLTDVFPGNSTSYTLLIWNELGRDGAEAICNSLLKNNTLKVLDLTGNQFQETDAVFFRKLLEENCGIRELYLGHNYFREEGGEILAHGIAQNDTLKVLDLSWNHLRLRGAKAIGSALTTNNQLESLNVAWNGLYIEGVSHLGQALVHNSTLTQLDISCNRLSEPCVASFISGLAKNNTLRTLKVGRNHISHEGAIGILNFIKAHPSIGLRHLDLGDQHVHDDFISVLKEIQKHRDIEVKFGTIFSRDRDPLGKQDQTEDELALLNENPHFVLMEFMRLQKLRLVDLFHQMDKDNSKGISVAEFQQGLQAVNIPLKTKTLRKFVKSCDADNNGEIDYSELLDARKLYKEQLRKHMRAGIPLEQTSVGRIQKLVRKIMITNDILAGFGAKPQPGQGADGENGAKKGWGLLKDKAALSAL